MRRARLLDYIFFLRPVLLVPVWTIFLLGSGGDLLALGTLDVSQAAGLLSMTAVFGGAFVLNQYFDQESDKRNRKCLFLPSGLIGGRAALCYYAVLNLIALGGLYWAPRATLFVVLVLSLGVIYSCGPWRWKDRPYLALVANGVAHGLLVFQAGRAVAGSDVSSAFLSSLPYGCGVCAVYLLTTIPDLEGDRQSGKRTLAVTRGPLRTARWALGWSLAALLLAVYAVDVLFVLASFPALPAFVRAGRGHLGKIDSAVRWSVGGLSCAAALLYPWYAAVLLVGFFATRSYYRRWWDCTYP